MTIRSTPKAAGAERLGKLESSVAVLQHQVRQLEERHESVPERVTRLEGQYEHMSGQLGTLNEGQENLTAKVTDLAGKVTKLLIVMSLLGALAQAAIPTLIKMVLP